ncbi:hypothetical protein [Escherichia coli]|uniref:hypothetical protein n=1 Tax=Escherichia coli TaxID=562 RepID=UPI002237B31D|nr:hypothetical protein [Escherichia coli]MCW7363987.1 hypothetical protein [Escherichia coli]
MNQNDIEAMIQRYTEAEMAVLDGKSVTFNGQQMTMENLSEIRQGRQEWERRRLAGVISRCRLSVLPILNVRWSRPAKSC